VTVNLDTQGAQIDGVDLRYLNFNPSLLQVQDANSGTAGVQVAPGSLMPLTLSNSVDNNLGRITFSQVVIGGSKYKGSGTLATITFKAISSGTANVTFNYTSGATTDSNVASAGTDVLNSVVNGSYTIGGSSSGGSSGGGAGGGGGGGSVTVTSGGSASSGNSFSPSVGGGLASSGATGLSCVPGLPIGQITSAVGLGSSNANVTNLQKFLVEMSYLTADSVTGYFGPLTQSALQKFQAAQGIVSSGDPLSTGFGNAGPGTRAKINALILSSIPKNCAVGSTVASTPVTSSVGGALTRNLSRGSSGSDVTVLQQFLVSQGYITSDSVTGYFGPLTEAGLKKFQAAQGIVSSGDPLSTGFGNAGPGTRARINALLGSVSTSSSQQSLQAQIEALQQQVNELLQKLQKTQ
jgi:peptidoglycan hydrolase-like protein with peptidoglycan-binding domain